MISRQRRRDLQGVRALAVLLVALSHAGVGFLRGGYVGVDVFFVLSGYFITRLLLDEAADAAQRGTPGARISLTGFYGRRAKRILPAACLTLVVADVAAYLFLDRVQAASILRDSIPATFFYANVHYGADSTNYFAQALGGPSGSPFQHFWSLSIEEQFYFVWPSLLIAAFFLARLLSSPGPSADRERRVANCAVAAIIAVGLAGSLCWSIHSTATSPQSAYFSTFTRVWELAMGAGVALGAQRLSRLPPPAGIALGWLGIAMILAAATVYTPHTPFPGIAALLPTVGCALLIIAGLGAATSRTQAPRGGARHSIGRLLGVPPMTYVGDRSYTFYLWHYVALILVADAVGHTLPVTTNLLLLLGAFALSVVTYRFYENPLRHADWLSGHRAAVLVPIALGCAVAASALPIAAIDAEAQAQAAIARNLRLPPLQPAPGHRVALSVSRPQPIPAVVDAVAEVRSNDPITPALTPAPDYAERDLHATPPGCSAKTVGGVTSRICHLGDPTGEPVVVLGDSHAGMWVPPLAIVGKRLHLDVIPLLHPGCLLQRLDIDTPGLPCRRWYSWALAQTHRLHPSATIVAFWWDEYPRSAFGMAVTSLHRVLGQVPHGILIADPPASRQIPAECITTDGATMGSCATPESPETVPLLQRITAMAKRSGDPVIPTLQWFCADRVCPSVINHTITRWDTTHLTVTYGRELAPLLAPEVRVAIRRLTGRSDSSTGGRHAEMATGPG